MKGKFMKFKLDTVTCKECKGVANVNKYKNNLPVPKSFDCNHFANCMKTKKRGNSEVKK